MQKVNNFMYQRAGTSSQNMGSRWAGKQCACKPQQLRPS